MFIWYYVLEEKASEKTMIYNTWSVTHKVYNRNILWRNVNTDEAHIHIMMKRASFI